MSEEYPVMQEPLDPMPADYVPYEPPAPDSVPVELPAGLADAVRAARRVVVFSGAGMSQESGVPTFRDSQTGLWENFDVATLATPEAFEDDPEFVWARYLWRARTVRDVWPNAGHLAVAAWGRRREVEVVTQNVDDLHERAGSVVTAHLHGSFFAYRCSVCQAPYTGEVELPTEPVERLTPPTCPQCGELVRPDVVWFGEVLPEEALETTLDLLESLGSDDLLVAVGTSGAVYPAAGMPAVARAAGATIVEVNPDETEISDHFHFVVRDTAARALPAMVRLLDEA